VSDSLHILLKFDPYLPWFRGILGGIETYAEAEGGWQFIFDQLHPTTLFQGQTYRGQVHGVISDRPDSWALERGIPQVSISIGDTHPDCPCFTTDFTEVGRMAARHLIESGYRELALLPLREPVLEVDRNRDNGFQQIAEGRGIPCHRLCLPGLSRDDSLLFTPENLEGWRILLRSLPRPLGIFARNLIEGYPLHTLMKELGLKIPGDYGLIVGGNDEQLLNALRPSITGIDRNDWGIGYKAAEALHGLLQGRRGAERTEISPVGILVRDSTRLRESADPFVEQVMDLMREQLAHPLNLPELAARFGVSAKTMERRFKEDLFQTPGRVFARIRIDRAKELLATDRHTISEVSEACGFMESSQLSRAFKQETGMSPREFRKRMLNERGF